MEKWNGDPPLVSGSLGTLVGTESGRAEDNGGRQEGEVRGFRRSVAGGHHVRRRHG